MSATAAMDARTLLGLLGRERRRLRRTREAAPRHAECQVRFGPPGRARPRRQSQSEEAWRASTWAPLRRASPQMVQGGTSAAMDEWIAIPRRPQHCSNQLSIASISHFFVFFLRCHDEPSVIISEL